MVIGLTSFGRGANPQKCGHHPLTPACLHRPYRRPCRFFSLPVTEVDYTDIIDIIDRDSNHWFFNEEFYP
jgi:hypothetical protein